MKFFDQHQPLSGSEKSVLEGTRLDTLNPAEILQVTVRVRRKKPLDQWLQTRASTGQVVSRNQFGALFGAAPADLQLVEDFAASYELSVVEVSAERRSVVLRGTVAQMSRAFGIYLANYRLPNGLVFRGRTGTIQIPKVLEGVVEGVFGLDNRPIAEAHFQILKGPNNIFAPHATGASFNPNELAKIYNFPADVTGKGQCIAIIELGGGYRTADIQAYFKALGLKSPSVSAVAVDGGHNSPSTPDGADGEVMLDIEVAGAVAPDAKIVVYFAPNTDQGFLDAITTALHDNKNKPSVISISWGSAEKNWTPQSLNSFNQAFQSAAALGVTICAAAGDGGSDDGVQDGLAHVDFPSSSPYVLACGGTKLTVKGTTVQNEVVWHASNSSATGGGVSDTFDLPAYQQNAHVPKSVNDGQRIGRGVPDIAAVADPSTGYNVRVDGQNFVIGGTSAVAPLMAGLLALINQKLKRNVGFIHPKIYANANVFRDILTGDNITAPGKGYTAGAGWDACTGLGAPDGQQLVGIL